MDPRAGRPPVVAIPPELAPRADSYSLYPPSPPHIHVPVLADMQQITLPAYSSFSGCGLSEDEIRDITQVQQLVSDITPEWRYESRRAAQQILPFLYLGPYSAAKDRTFLRGQEITLLLVLRDLKSAQASLMSGDRVAQELGIASVAVDLQGPMELIAAFPRVIGIINEHLLAVHRQRAVVNGVNSNPMHGPAAANHQRSFRHGKVLVFCESGNERSASCVVAYLMAMFGLDLVAAIQLTQSQRFCIALSDDLKMLLLNFQDILCAQRDVRIAPPQIPGEGLDGDPVPAFKCKQSCKRDAREMDFGDDINEEKHMDQERFLGRINLVPFSDTADV